MNMKIAPLCFVICSLLGGFISPAQSLTTSSDKFPETNPARNFSVQKISEGVFAMIRQDPPGVMVDANSIVIINDQDVVVVDTGGAPSMAKEVIAEIRKLTAKPVRYVINTHWHDDHIRGNIAYREAFPGVDFIGQARTFEYLPGTGAVNRKKFLEGAPKNLEVLRSSIAKNQSLSGAPITDEERTSYSNDVRLAEFVLSEAAMAPTILPTITLEDTLTLHRGARTIEIKYLGRGHTSGDIVVHLPEEGILITGDLVIWPIPLIGNDQSHIGDWAITLKKLIALKPKFIIPGHGPVLQTDEHLRLMSNMFAFISEQTEKAVQSGKNLEETRKSVSLADFQRQFTGDSQLREVIFHIYVEGPAIAAAFADASAKKLKAG